MLASELIEILEELIKTEGDYPIVYPNDEWLGWPEMVTRAVPIYVNNRQFEGNVIQIE